MKHYQPTEAQRERVSRSKRIVVKIGSALLAKGGTAIFSQLAGQIAAWMPPEKECVIVSSGAIAFGIDVMGLKKRPTQVSLLQAAAAAGQPRLQQHWSKAFARQNIHVAEVLLTHADLANRERFLNARHALAALIAHGVVPIINENDSVSTDEIRVGDNDSLSAQVASLVNADLLILLTTVDGLYTANPDKDPTATHIPLVTHFGVIEDFATSESGISGLGVGGMHTKVQAAKTCSKRGIAVVIADGRTPQVLKKILAGKTVGTLFLPSIRVASRKHWIGFTLKPTGVLRVDAGATDALVRRGRSLLASGITHVEGKFDRGAMVEIVGPSGPIARGLAAYAAHELTQLMGKNSKDIARILGYVSIPEAVHRDDLTLLEYHHE